MVVGKGNRVAMEVYQTVREVVALRICRLALLEARAMARAVTAARHLALLLGAVVVEVAQAQTVLMVQIIVAEQAATELPAQLLAALMAAAVVRVGTTKVHRMLLLAAQVEEAREQLRVLVMETMEL